MNVPHVIYKPGKEMYKLFYKTFISEYEVFDDYRNCNYVCEICTSLIWACVANYAIRNNIPCIISGLDPHQLKKDKYNAMSTKKLSRINEKTFEIGSKNYMEALRNTQAYRTNEKFREFSERNFLLSGNVKTLYPFLYINYDITTIKEIVKEKVDWKPYTDTDINEYKTSGCKISSIIPLLEELKILECKKKEEVIKTPQFQEILDNLFE